MKKIIFILILSLLFIPFTDASAQMMYGVTRNAPAASGMMGYPAPSTTSTSNLSGDANETTGQAIAQKLQTKTVTCADLSQQNYEDLGEYYMGLMMGSSHDSMEQYIEHAYGIEYLKAVHSAMGERFSGCNLNATFPAGMTGFGPMMGGYGIRGNLHSGGQYGPYSMLDWRFPGIVKGYDVGSTALATILWVLTIIGLITAARWVFSRFKK